jgi:tryptophanase
MSSLHRDIARDFYLQTLAEPYRIKVVERLRLPELDERQRILASAHYSPALIDASDVYIDLASDSGTGAMSDEQWAAMIVANEAYVRSKSFFRFENVVREIFALEHVVPTHQGRAAENILMELLVTPGDVVLSNTHSDTTRAHIEARGGVALDLVGESVWHFEKPENFKGNFDLRQLQRALALNPGRVVMIIITIVNNLAGSAPVSMENIRAVSALAREFKVPVFFDACRFAENAMFVKLREPGFERESISGICQAMFSMGDGCWMSGRKDALVNSGGFIAVRDSELASRCKERVLHYEGFHTQGGLAARDLEAMAVGLREGIDEEHLLHRTGLVAYLGENLARLGFSVSMPPGGSAIFVDPAPTYPHLEPNQLPGIALFCDLYLIGGIRVGPMAFAMKMMSDDGRATERPVQWVRFAMPRRSYGKAHVDYVIRIAEHVKQMSGQSPAYRVMPSTVPRSPFFAQFEPLSRETSKSSSNRT